MKYLLPLLVIVLLVSLLGTTIVQIGIYGELHELNQYFQNTKELCE